MWNEGPDRVTCLTLVETRSSNLERNLTADDSPFFSCVLLCDSDLKPWQTGLSFAG
jgi:hypothetical protein